MAMQVVAMWDELEGVVAAMIGLAPLAKACPTKVKVRAVLALPSLEHLSVTRCAWPQNLLGWGGRAFKQEQEGHSGIDGQGEEGFWGTGTECLMKQIAPNLPFSSGEEEGDGGTKEGRGRKDTSAPSLTISRLQPSQRTHNGSPLWSKNV